MKVYVAARYKGTENKEEIDALCRAVRDAKLVDFNFARDIDNYKHAYDDSQELWDRVHDEITACNIFLVDVSDYPTGSRLVEAGIAYAKHMPIIVVKKRGVTHKRVFEGIASVIIEYVDYKDLAAQLYAYESERNFSVNDRMAILVSVVLVGLLMSAAVAQLFMPLGLLVAILYWIVVRWLFPPMRPFDRVVIYIPLAFVWLSVTYLLMHLYIPLAIAWFIGFWIVTISILKKIKFSL